MSRHQLQLCLAALLLSAAAVEPRPAASAEPVASAPAEAGPDQPWSLAAPRVTRDIAAGKPLVISVVVPLCSNDQIDCGSEAFGRPGDLRTNLYWGALFGARRFFERQSLGWERLELRQDVGGALERGVYRRWLPGAPWGLPPGRRVEQIVVLKAVHGSHIDAAVDRFWSVATGGGEVSFEEAGQSRRERVHVVGYAGHNRLMDGKKLGPASQSPGGEGIPSFVLACYSDSYFSSSLQQAGSKPLLMTRQLMAPEGYAIEAFARALGGNESPRWVRLRVIDAYAKSNRIDFRVAARVFAPPAAEPR